MSGLLLPGKPQDSLAVAPGEDTLGGLPPRQPLRGEVLGGLEAHRQRFRDFQPEDVFGVVRDTLRIAVTPYRIDFVDVLQVPRFEAVAAGIDSRLFAHLANRGVAKLLSRVLASGDRLPGA